MNSFRDAVSRGQGAPSGPLMPAKKPLRAEADGLGAVQVPRAETRTTDLRDGERHRLTAEQALLQVGRKRHVVDLVNLSGGGAMVRTDLPLKLWKRVDLVLGDCDAVECAVRWIRGDRVGLEFAHETQVSGDPAKRDAMLLDVLHRTFPHLRAIAPAAPTAAAPPQDRPAPDAQPAAEPRRATGEQRRAELRHPLIWSGDILYNHDTTRVRLRNISEHGALLDCPVDFPQGAEVLLDLGGAGQHFAFVNWSRGDQLGLRFTRSFDIGLLAKAKPEVAPQGWERPDYLNAGRDECSDDASPWAAPWKRLTLPELKDSLEGFLKR